MCPVFIIYSLVYEHLGYFKFLTTKNRALVSMAKQVSLK